MGQVNLVDHPLVLHKLSLMRDKTTSTSKFRALLHEIALLLGYEVTRDLPLETAVVETPVSVMEAPVLSGKKVVVVAILRAGSGMLDGILSVLPSARVGHIGLARDPETLQPKEYLYKVPSELSSRSVLVVDPMLATGNSAVAAVSRLKESGARDIKFLCLVAAPEGIATFHSAHPDVPIYTPVIDSHLNEHGYIVPGLGDAGDRLYGTR